MKISRLFVLIFGIFVPVYILITFLSFDFSLDWLPSDWSYNSQTVWILVNIAAPIFYCIAWLYFNFLLGHRFARSLEIMAGSSSSISLHYIVFYGVNALVLLVAFLIPIFTPIVGVLAFSSMVFNLLTMKTSWDDMDEKKKKSVKTISILAAIPIVFVSIFVVPELIIHSIDFSKDFWAFFVDPLFWLVKAYGVSIPIGNFINLYKKGVAEVEGKRYERNNLNIFFIELTITGFLFFLESQGVEFVTFLYYAGMFFWIISLFANLKAGRSREGKLTENPIGLVLNGIFWVAWFIFGKRDLDPSLAWVKLALTIVSAVIFFSYFVIIFIGHPDLEDS
ncbi:MAG: hypothetical protein ACTSYI_07665 [Promethearchaeota archaeon]